MWAKVYACSAFAQPHFKLFFEKRLEFYLTSLFYVLWVDPKLRFSPAIDSNKLCRLLVHRRSDLQFGLQAQLLASQTIFGGGLQGWFRRANRWAQSHGWHRLTRGKICVLPVSIGGSIWSTFYWKSDLESELRLSSTKGRPTFTRIILRYTIRIGALMKASLAQGIWIWTWMCQATL